MNRGGVQFTPTAPIWAQSSNCAAQSPHVLPLAVVLAVRHEKAIQAVSPGKFCSRRASTMASRKQGMVSKARRSAPASANTRSLGSWKSARAWVSSAYRPSIFRSVRQHRAVRSDGRGNEGAQASAPVGFDGPKFVPRGGGQRHPRFASVAPRLPARAPFARMPRRLPDRSPSWRHPLPHGSSRGARRESDTGRSIRHFADHNGSRRSMPRRSSSVASAPSRTMKGRFAKKFRMGSCIAMFAPGRLVSSYSPGLGLRRTNADRHADGWP